MGAKRALMKRTGSVETEGGQDSPRGRTPGGSSSRTSNGGSSRFKKSMSIGETISEGDNLWKSTDSARGSNESLASNASIPLPIPVRTRSAHGGPGVDSADYNALSIRRLERDTSMDRLSTGSKESNMSTQSEWIGGEKKKKSGLIGKLKALSKKDDKEFGSGSDISSVSVSSNMSAFAKAAHKKARALSKDRGASKEREKSAPPKKPEEANQPFDKYFDDASKSGVGPTSRGREPTKPGTPASGPSTQQTGSKPVSKWKVEEPRTYRRF